VAASGAATGHDDIIMTCVTLCYFHVGYTNFDIIRTDANINRTNADSVGRFVVVIDVNPSHGFWTARLMKVFGHEGKCTCRYNTHGWIVYIMLFPVVCGTSRGSSWLRRNEFLKMTK
jgi:hypothetical protein